MKLELKRNGNTKGYTAGILYVDGFGFCKTLEDEEREKKIISVTAIPKGTYEVVISYSNRFKKLLPLLLNVPNYSGVRIHSGNTAENTEGCILIGMSDGNDKEGWLGNSRLAMDKFLPLLTNALKTQKVWLTIS